MDHRIRADLKARYSIDCMSITPVSGGLLNLKWKVATPKGAVLVKQYSNRRFSRKKIEAIECALQRQNSLRERGVPCPFLYEQGGRVIHWLEGEIAYLVMEFCPGQRESVATITVPQMYSLGFVCAGMHRAFSQLPGDCGQVLDGTGLIKALSEHVHESMSGCQLSGTGRYRAALGSLEAFSKNLSVRFFEGLPQGLAHEDFHSGNLLFHAREVSAVLDFDRSCHNYLWHDIGRAILSFALEGDTLNMDRARAFAAGYSSLLPLTLGDVGDALRLTLCIETPWWIRPAFLGPEDETPGRFRDEMLWLAEHWEKLDAILGV